MQKLLPTLLRLVCIFIRSAPALQIFEPVRNPGMVLPILVKISIGITNHIDQLIWIIASICLIFRFNVKLIQNVHRQLFHPILKLGSRLIFPRDLLEWNQITKSC